jgi:hypothetical protein
MPASVDHLLHIRFRSPRRFKAGIEAQFKPCTCQEIALWSAGAADAIIAELNKGSKVE